MESQFDKIVKQVEQSNVKQYSDLIVSEYSRDRVTTIVKPKKLKLKYSTRLTIEDSTDIIQQNTQLQYIPVGIVAQCVFNNGLCNIYNKRLNVIMLEKIEAELEMLYTMFNVNHIEGYITVKDKSYYEIQDLISQNSNDLVFEIITINNRQLSDMQITSQLYQIDEIINSLGLTSIRVNLPTIINEYSELTNCHDNIIDNNITGILISYPKQSFGNNYIYFIPKYQTQTYKCIDLEIMQFAKDTMSCTAIFTFETKDNKQFNVNLKLTNRYAQELIELQNSNFVGKIVDKEYELSYTRLNKDNLPLNIVTQTLKNSI